MNYQNRKFEHTTFEEQLIIQASLYNKSFTYNKIQPSVFFWKQITANPQDPPLCLIPDTLVLNQKQSQLIWIYSDQNLRIRKQTNINFKDFISKLTTYSSPNELVAILKRPIFNQKLTYSNDFRLLNSKYLMNASQQQIGQKEQVLCLQRFIKSSGAKAFICRTVYSTQKSSECFLITNTRSFFEKSENQNKKFAVKAGDKSIIVKSKQGRNLQQTVKYLKSIVKHLVFIRGIEISEIVGDFIKDQLGNWWLINIKAFKVIEKVKKNLKSKKQIFSSQQIEKERYQKTKSCRYCQKSYLQSELTLKMTMKMIIEVDKYLLHLGKEYGWLKRSDISNIDSYFLYQEHRVCERCFRLYSQIQQLMQVEKKLLVKQGHNLVAEPKQLIFSQTNEQHLRLQAKNKQIYRLNSSIPQIVQLGPNTNITVVDNCPMKNDEIINKMYRFRLIIYLNEIDEVSGLKTNTNYFLEFSLFGKKSKYKLNLGMVEKSKIIPLNKLKIFYFFTNSIESLENQYLSSNFSLTINISQQCKESHEKKNIGMLQLPFKELVIPINRKRDFYKFFHVEGISYGWGLQGSIGVIPSQAEVTTAKVSFEKTEGQIYIPNENYYFCEHLTEQWIDLIKTKCQKSMNRRLNMFSSKKYSYISQICDSRRKQRDSANMKSSRGEPAEGDQFILQQMDLNRDSEQKNEERTRWQQQLDNQIRKYEAENQKFEKKIKKQQYSLLC